MGSVTSKVCPNESHCPAMGASKWIRRGFQSLRRDGLGLFMRKSARFGRRLVSYVHARSAPLLPRRLRPVDAAFSAELHFVSDPIFRISARDIQASMDVQQRPLPVPIRTATWFVPPFYHVTYGGLFTIFRFIEGLAHRGVTNRVVIFDDPLFNAARALSMVCAHFPDLASLEIVVLDSSDTLSSLAPTDIAFCTWWPSAYLLLRFNQTNRKYYFVQDFEPAFYEAGSRYALAESTYRFGYYGVVNTPGVLRAIRGRYGMKGASFVPAVDSRYYYPSQRTAPDSRPRIFFYCRPRSRRNAFELGLLTILELLDRFSEGVEIVTAGEAWDEADYGLKGRITNLGLLSTPAEVGDLYRTCQIGFVYMLSKHPSYQPLEFMACGMTVVSNRNEDNYWLLRDRHNCLLAEPSPTAMADAISELISDRELLERLRQAGLEAVSTDWEGELDQVWQSLSSDRFD